VGCRHLGRQRHQGFTTAKRGQQANRVFIQTAQLRWIMHTFAGHVQIRALDMDTENAGQFGVDRSSHCFECARDNMQIIADKRR